MTTEEFILLHRTEDVNTLALNFRKTDDLDLPYALSQIEGWQRARKKLSSWAAVDGLEYPRHLSLEQSSSEETARYKALVLQRIVKSVSTFPPGNSERPVNECQTVGQPLLNDQSIKSEMSVFADLTAGFGVDFYYIAEALRQVNPDLRLVYVERQGDLASLAERNFKWLGLAGVEVKNTDGMGVFCTLPDNSIIFLDPARRDENQRRVYDISECEPNIFAFSKQLDRKAAILALKLSPMYDLRRAISGLNAAFSCLQVREAHIVSLGNECKEMFVVMCRNWAKMAEIYCKNSDEMGVFCISDQNLAIPYISDKEVEMLSSSPENGLLSAGNKPLYLYEPNASVMKAQMFSAVCRKYEIREIGENSHLMLSPSKIAHFIGRGFQILAVSSVNRKQLKSQFPDLKKANVSVRNFPLSAENLRKKLGLHDGGDTYIFATRVRTLGLKLLVCRKV